MALNLSLFSCPPIPPALPLTPLHWRLQPCLHHPVYTSCCCQLPHLTPELLLRGWCAEGVARWLIHTPGHTVTGLPVNMHKGACCCYLDLKKHGLYITIFNAEKKCLVQSFFHLAYIICSYNAGNKNIL